MVERNHSIAEGIGVKIRFNARQQKEQNKESEKKGGSTNDS